MVVNCSQLLEVDGVPQKDGLKSPPSQNVILFGSRAVADIIKDEVVLGVGPTYSQYDWCPREPRRRGHTEKRPRENREEGGPHAKESGLRTSQC